MTKDHKIIAALMVFAVTIAGVILFDPSKSEISTVKSYPATVCPGNLGNGTSTSVLPSSSTPVREIPSTKIVAKKANVIFHTLSFIGDESILAANATACASDEDKFLPFHALLYQTQS